jgi:hypothetical protein
MSAYCEIGPAMLKKIVGQEFRKKKVFVYPAIYRGVRRRTGDG